ncbi:MAG TPA: hypothetical protein VKY37_09630 [Brumimicrobium sp.]|nr:hypothetical protein [Brumimicrobium sp.]
MNHTMKEPGFKVKEKAKVSPLLSGLEEWVEGVVIKIFKNPFLGDEIAIKDEHGRIFFGEKKYFKKN